MEPTEARSEAKLSSFFDQVVAGVCETDVHGRFLRVNDRYCHITGWPRERLLSLSMQEITHPDDMPGSLPSFQAAVRDGKGFEIEKRYVRPDGTHVWVHNSVTPVKEPDGSVSSTICLTVDISQHRITEERLEERVAQRTAERDRVWRNSRDLIVVIDRRWTLLAVNPAVAPLLGYKPEEAVGSRFSDFLHPDDLRAAARSIRAAATSPVGDFEARVRAKDGSWRWFSWSAAPGEGEAYVSGRDITEEKQRQAELSAAEAAKRQADVLYRAYFENIPEALFVIRCEKDGGFVVEQINPAHERALGLKLQEVRGRRIEEIFADEAAQRVLGAYRQVMTTGEMLQYREVFELGAGPQHWDTSLVPVRAEDGRISRIIGSSRDVTRQIIAEETLRQSHKMEALGQLTGGIAHDFNNLLTPIVGALDLLRRKTDDERSKRLLDGAAASAERARTLITRLLSFARKQRLESRDIPLRKLLLGTVDMLERTIGPSILIEVDLPDENLCVRVDPNQLELALLNLAVNARDAMEEGGRLVIRALKERAIEPHQAGLRNGDYARISVEDFGSGMDERTLRMAIEPFYSTKELGKGTGLGLSMVHGLATQSGGGLRITSKEGQGTTVDMWLPLGTDVLEPRTDELHEFAGGVTPLKILLVDDEDLVRAATAEMLVEAGHTVHQAHSGPAAIQMFEVDSSYDVIVTDYAMPLMSGAAVIRRIQELSPETRALLVTGYASATTDVPQYVPRMEKPFRASELIRKVEEVASREGAGTRL